MPDFARYLQRISYLLRQGEPANQVALLLPTDDAWASFSPGNVTVTGAMDHLITSRLMSAILSAGYNIDFIDADAMNRLGFRHPLLVLPPTDRIPLAALRKIKQYVAAGGKAIAVGRAPSLDEEGQALPEISALSSQLFDTGKSTLVAHESDIPDALHKAVDPDFEVEGDNESIGFIRRKLPGADIYFVANTGNHPFSAHARLASKYAFCEQWNIDTGEAIAGIARIGPEDVPLALEPYESAVFACSDNAPHRFSPHGPKEEILDLTKGWKVTFTALGRSLPDQTPTDWTADPATRFYSGEAIYKQDFSLRFLPSGPVFLEVQGGASLTQPSNSKGPGMRAWYDPPIREAAIVFLNGRRVGALWHPPYRLPVSGYLKTGQNHLEIHVYNTAVNAWAALPPRDYSQLTAKYGERFKMQDLDQVKPDPSGLLGTVRLFEQAPQ
jgi:hypothetical protein